MSHAKREIDQAAKLIWDYHHMHQSLEKADCMIVLGSSDVRVAEYGASLFLKQLAPIVVFSGGAGSLTKNRFKRSEAEIFAEIATNLGVPKDKILREDKSTNTGDNILFSFDLLKENNLCPDSVIVVTKPYMERRTYATAKRLFPDRRFLVTSPSITFEDYPTSKLNRELVLNIMVGDLQRIMKYPAKGFQIEMEVPSEVSDAYNTLLDAGYNKHLIKAS